jgi:short-subunit dehydrogenase
MSLWEVNRSVRYFNLVAGIWMIAGSLLLHIDDSPAAYHNIICGAALIVFSMIKGKTSGSFGGGWQVLLEPDREYFKGKVVVITGASGGVGRVTAWAFAKQGAKVALIARDKLQLAATAKEVEVYGGLPLVLQIDVADDEELEDAAAEIEKKLGPIDVWINNAMNSVFAPVSEVTAEEFKRVTEVTYLGSVYGAMYALKRMKPRNKGTIIFVGSALAYRGIPLQSAYCGAKHGIQGFYDSLRVELMHDKSDIKLCMIQLPAMDTTQFGWVLNKLPNKTQPMGKIYKPEVAAKAILFAARRNRREIIVGSSSYKAIWGNTVAPWYADWVLSKKGYEGQQTTEPVDPQQKNNLWGPVGEDRGAYGTFGAKAANTSVSLWISMNRGWIAAGMSVALVLFSVWQCSN